MGHGTQDRTQDTCDGWMGGMGGGVFKRGAGCRFSRCLSSREIQDKRDHWENSQIRHPGPCVRGSRPLAAPQPSIVVYQTITRLIEIRSKKIAFRGPTQPLLLVPSLIHDFCLRGSAISGDSTRSIEAKTELMRALLERQRDYQQTSRQRKIPPTGRPGIQKANLGTLGPRRENRRNHGWKRPSPRISWAPALGRRWEFGSAPLSSLVKTKLDFWRNPSSQNRYGHALFVYPSCVHRGESWPLRFPSNFPSHATSSASAPRCVCGQGVQARTASKDARELCDGKMEGNLESTRARDTLNAPHLTPPHPELD